MRVQALLLIAVIMTALACSSSTTSSEPAAGSAISCDAKLTNQSTQLLTINTATSNPTGKHWSTTFAPGDQIKPGGSIGATTSDTSGECSAAFTFQLPDGRKFNASFDNRTFGDSTWDCEQISGLKCAVTGNKTGQPLKVRYTLTDQ